MSSANPAVTPAASSEPLLRYEGFDHIKFWVGNAKQAASYYVTRLGFSPLAFQGLETGCRDVSTHVVKQGAAVFAFATPTNPGDASEPMYRHMLLHGDGVRDIAFTVEDCRRTYQRALERGAVSAQEPRESSDENGSVVTASIVAYNDTLHTFVERKNYRGPFLPNFRAVPADSDASISLLPPVGIQIVDHLVGNHPDQGMVPIAEWYAKVMDLHQFWSVDETQIHSEYSALRSIVMTDGEEKVKMPQNEPAPGKRKSQIQEFCDYYSGSGVQHIALRSNDIIHSVSALRARGVQFITVPDTYYQDLRKRLATAPIRVEEDLNELERLKILVDFDENGYLLQLFTKPMQDRPTLFIEILQRHNHNGFGVGNFKSLFEAIERDQAERGNL